MNKKGLVFTIPLIVGIIVVVIISLIFASINKWILMGGAIMVLSFIFAIPAALKGDFTRGKIFFLLSLFLIGGLIMVLPQLGLVQMTGYDAPSSGVLVQEIYGDFLCKNTEDWGPMSTVQNSGMKSDDGGFLGCAFDWYEYSISCIGVGTKGCQYKVNQWDCPDPKLLCGGNEEDKYTINDGSFKDPSNYNWINMNDGETATIKTYCNSNTGFVKMIEEPQIDFRQPSKKIYVNTYGKSWSGWLAGSEGCKLVSADLEAINMINAQDKLDIQVYAGQSYPFGVKRNFVTGWEEVIAFGNINPLGQYNNKDVVCKAFDGIYEAEQMETVNGKIYYKKGSQLRSYIADNTMCCNNAQCGIGTCDVNTYTCTTAEHATCEFGGCSYAKVGNILGTECEEKIGKFYLITQTCGDDLCIDETELEVECCRDYCDRQYGADYYCNYEKGCELVTIQKPCPPGMCCLEGGNYKVSNCPITKECCVDETVDKFTGVCREECLPQESKTEEELDIDAKARCDLLIATNPIRYQWIEGIDAPWYDILHKDQPAYCKDNYTIYFILGGIGVVVIIVAGMFIFTAKKSDTAKIKKKKNVKK